MGPPDVTVTPEGWLARGAAFVRGDGVMLTVFGGIPGERARVRIMGAHGRQEHARFLRPAGAPHPERVEPPCDRYVPCGRCPLMHLTPNGQDRTRIWLAAEALREVNVAVPIDPVVHVGGAETLHSLSLITGYSDERRSRLGVRGQDGRDVVPIPECTITTPTLRELMKVAAHLMRELEIWPFDGHKGTLRAITARQSPVDGNVLVTLVAARQNPVLAEYALRMASALPAISGVIIHRNEEKGDAFAVDEEGGIGISVLYGNATLTLPIGELRLKSGASDPWPEHPAMRERIVTSVVDLLNPSPGDAVVELDAGDGAATMLAAKRTGWALGLIPAEAVARRARENAVANGVTAEFTSGPLDEAWESARPRLAGRRPLVLASASTRGFSDAFLQSLGDVSPRRVVLTGSNPKSFARNLRQLAELGMPPRRVIPFDQAPNTPFAQLVAVCEHMDQTAPEKRAPRRKLVR